MATLGRRNRVAGDVPGSGPQVRLLLAAALAASPAVALEPADWYRSGQELVAERRASLDPAPARNVILFIGDGMSLATVTAARILEGQLRGQSGEENLLYFETFPHTAFAKTYNTDQQTPDSAGTMTAMATGVKTFAGGIAIDGAGRRSDCEAARGRERVSLIELAAHAGLGTGIVTTTRITHATPAALYAKNPERYWEVDSGLAPAAADAGCRDMARQLVEFDTGGHGLDVVLGGGRAAFQTAGESDPEYPDRPGLRRDESLLQQWRNRFPEGTYLWNREQFDSLDVAAVGPVLGLFEPDHMRYEHDRADDPAGEPSLAEMTRFAIRRLSAREKGYFLMVEGGRIDHAHHANNAYRALTDTIAFADAVRAAVELADPNNTLIVVTADHGHALAFGGYGVRGADILGLARSAADRRQGKEFSEDSEGKPYTVLSYINGPGFRAGKRPDYREANPADPDFRQEALVGRRSSSHGGEDVPVYARGPGAEVLHGVIEQHVIFHALAQAQPALQEAAESLAGEDGLPDWRALQAFGDGEADSE